MVPTESEEALERKVTEIIDNELLKANFEEQCQRICKKIFQKVQSIEDDHQDIKKLFNNIGERVDILLADDHNDENIVEKVQRNSKDIIVIDDDDDDDDDDDGENDNDEKVSREVIMNTNNTPNNLSKTPGTNSATDPFTSPTSNSSTTTAVSKSNNTSLKKIENVINKLNSKNVNISPKGETKLSEQLIRIEDTNDKAEAEEISRKDIPNDSMSDRELSNSDEHTNIESSAQNSLNKNIDQTLDVTNKPATNSPLKTIPDSRADDLGTVSDHLDSSSSNALTPCDQNTLVVDKTSTNNLRIPSSTADRPTKSAATLPNRKKVRSSNSCPSIDTNPVLKDVLTASVTTDSKGLNDTNDDASKLPKEKTSRYHSKLSRKRAEERNDLRIKTPEAEHTRLSLKIIKDTPKNPPRIKQFSFVKDLVVYAKPVKSDIWYQAKLLQEVQKKRGKSFLVQFLSGQKPQQKIDRKCIATRSHCHIDDVKLGTRIVAGRPSDTVNSAIQKKYKDINATTSYTVMFAGTIAELACTGNRYRYLVFFDDGYAQYLPLNRIFPVVSTSDEVWNDVAVDCQEFIKEYLQEYPFRPLVVTKVGCTMQTEWNGEWWQSRVVSVDSSLVKILFDVDKRSEWIYRGTTRLEAMYNHFVNPPTKPTKPKRGRKAAARSIKEESFVDEIITDPQYGICKFSITDPQGEKQIEKWGKPLIEKEKIVDKCLEDTVSLKSPRLQSPPAVPKPTTTAPVDIKLVIRKKKKRASSASPRSHTAEQSSTSGVTPPQRRTKKTRVEKHDEDEFQVKTPEPFSPPISVVTDSAPPVENIKEEISQEDLLGALSALATSPTEGGSSNMCSPKSDISLPSVDKKGNILEMETTTQQVGLMKRQRTTAPTLKLPAKHACSESCIVDRRNMLDYHRSGSTNYLSIPFYLGWKRESAKKSSSYHRDIYYRAPCNKRMRNLSEVTKYLLLTKCVNVCIDMFCFHSKISCRSHPSKSKNPKVKKEDLSDGRETCPVVLINEVSEELPPHLAYISSRNKAEDVFINIDPGFLVCCDCTDFCQDKTKCQCAQLTVEQSNAIDGVIDKNAGYHYRRLKECITTGIYECNPNCSCTSSCHNRVVQNGILLRLQVFMTENRGWGLQCIDDIPKGTFICTYAGQILNEHTANREGMDYGDEYLAELDHIEVIEKAKEGYESDVPELREKTYNRSDSESLTESESSDSVINISSDSSDSDCGLKMEPLAKKLKSLKELEERRKDANRQSEPIVINEKTDNENISKVEADVVTLLDANTSSLVITETPEKESSASSSCKVTLKRIPSADIPRKKEDDIVTTPNIKQKDDARKTNSGRSIVPLAKKSTCQVAIKRQAKDIPKEVEEKVVEKLKEKLVSTRSLYHDDDQMFVIDAKSFGNVGRFMNHCCSPNLFVQNVMVDTHDLRFPWVAFFAHQNIPAYTELTWDYSYEIGSVPGKTLTCKCGASNCKGRLL